MNLSRSGMMIILSSPSGAGKTTLVKLLSEKDKNLKLILDDLDAELIKSSITPKEKPWSI